MKKVISLLIFTSLLALGSTGVAQRCEDLFTPPQFSATQDRQTREDLTKGTLETRSQNRIFQVMIRLFDGHFAGLNKYIPEIAQFSDMLLISGINPQTVEGMPNGSGGWTHNHFGYWPANVAKIDDRIGGAQDFMTLIHTAKTHNLKVIVDAVIGHFGYASISGGQANPFEFNDAHYDSFANVPRELLRSERNIEPGDWNQLASLTEGRDILNMMDTVFSQKRLFGLPGFDHRNPAVKRFFIEAFKAYIDMGVDGFRIDAALYIDRFFMSEFINELNHYAKSKHRSLRFYLELVTEKNIQLSSIAEDIVSRIEDKNSVYFFDFPLMFELRRLAGDPNGPGGYQLQWLEGYWKDRKNTGLTSLNMIPNVINHDFGFPIEHSARETLIQALSLFIANEPALIFQGMEDISARRSINQIVSKVKSGGRSSQLNSVLTEIFESTNTADLDIVAKSETQMVLARSGTSVGVGVGASANSARVADTGAGAARVVASKYVLIANTARGEFSLSLPPDSHVTLLFSSGSTKMTRHRNHLLLQSEDEPSVMVVKISNEN
jgi:hypothetical protein